MRPFLLLSFLFVLLAADEVIAQPGTNAAESSTKTFNTHDRYITIGMGYGFGRRANIGTSEYASLTLGLYQRLSEATHMGVSITYSEHVSIGNGQWQDNILPITIDGRWMYKSYWQGRMSLFLSGSIGLNHVLNRRYFNGDMGEYIRVRNGLFISPMLASQINITENFGLLLDFGYRYGGNRQFVESNNLDRGNIPTTHFFARGSVFF